MPHKFVTETRTVEYPKGLMNPEDLVNFHSLPGFTKNWKRLGLTDFDRDALEVLIMADPRRAPIIRGTGGLRKCRFSPPDWNVGKSGALRIGYAYKEYESIVMLVAVYAKHDKADLSAAERREIKKLLPEAWKRILWGALLERIGARMTRKKGTRKEGETFGESVIDSLKGFLDAADRGEQITVRRVKLNLEPRRYTPEEVKWTRERLRVSQALFAQLLGVSPKTVESWESLSKISPPPGPVCRLLEEINADPTAFLHRHLGRSAIRQTAKRRTREHA